MKSTNRTCRLGHHYIKSSDCPTCPICESLRKPKGGFLSHFAAPARRALENKKITSIEQLSHYKENEIKELHAIGHHAIQMMRVLLKQAGLDFVQPN